MATPQTPPALTADDEDFGGSYRIKKPERLWNEQENQKFNQNWNNDVHNFATVLDRDKNGNPIKTGVFGGQSYYRVRLANGETAFLKEHPGDPFVFDIKPIDVPVNEGQWTSTEIRPGSGKYAGMLSTVQNATDPRTGASIGANLRPNNLADVVTNYNNYQFSTASQAKQGEARDFERWFRGRMNLDGAYADAEKQIKTLGQDKLKALTDWASKSQYIAGGKLTDDQKSFYTLLNDYAQISRAGAAPGSGAQPLSGAGVTAQALTGISFLHPFTGVADVVKALQASEFDPLDVATNIHKLRLLNKQDALNTLSEASYDATLPLNPDFLKEGRTQAHDFEGSEKLKNTDNAYNAPTMWDIMEQEKKKEQTGAGAGAQAGATPLPAAVAPTGAILPTESTAEPMIRGRVPQNPNIGDIYNAVMTNPKQAFQDLIQHPERTWPGIRILPEGVKLYGNKNINRTMPENAPIGRGPKPGDVVQEPAATREEMRALFNKAPAMTPALTPPLEPQKIEVSPIVPSQGQASNSGGLNVPRLTMQEHVDALDAGTPFYWQDHPDAYVKT